MFSFTIESHIFYYDALFVSMSDCYAFICGHNPIVNSVFIKQPSPKLGANKKLANYDKLFYT